MIDIDIVWMHRLPISQHNGPANKPVIAATSSLFFFLAFRGDREKIYIEIWYTKRTMKSVQLRTTIIICIIILAYLLCVNAFNGHSTIKLTHIGTYSFLTRKKSHTIKSYFHFRILTGSALCASIVGRERKTVWVPDAQNDLLGNIYRTEAKFSERR